MRGLAGKVAIVTGGAGGIGTGTCRRLVEEGVKVAIADVNADAVHALSRELGKDTLPVVFDALDNDSVTAMVEKTAAHFGRLDFLDNNHALINEKATPLDTNIIDTPLWVWDDILAANARAFLVAARHAIPHMMKAGSGSIVNISSVAGLSGDNAMTSYAASKAAVVALTRSIARQYGKKGIRCNSIAPGAIITPTTLKHTPEIVDISARYTPNVRLGKVEDIAAMVAFLFSEDAGFVQGQLINVDGGVLANLPFSTDMEEMFAARG